jgi:hypothetical protein
MDPGPSKFSEAVVALFIPPACREEVLGDLHERFRSRTQYAADALSTVPLVIVSRMRRTSDPQVVFIQAFAMYLSFLGAAWFSNRDMLSEEWGLLRLAVPGAVAMSVLIVADAYRIPSAQPVWMRLAEGPCLGVGLAFICETMISVAHPDFMIPRWIMIIGGGSSLLTSTAIRMLFPPATDQLQGANAPAYWLERPGGGESGSGISRHAIRILRLIAAASIIAVIGIWAADRLSLGTPQVLTLAALLLVVYQLSRRS